MITTTGPDAFTGPSQIAYEHQVIELAYDDTLRRTLDIFGNDGWEVISVSVIPPPPSNDPFDKVRPHAVAVLRRAKCAVATLLAQSV